MIKKSFLRELFKDSRTFWICQMGQTFKRTNFLWFPELLIFIDMIAVVIFYALWWKKERGLSSGLIGPIGYHRRLLFPVMLPSYGGLIYSAAVT
jgi:hypothetical protein